MPSNRFEFEDLAAFQRALDLLVETDRLVPCFTEHRWKLGLNMVDAAGSVVYNIAESRGRKTVPDRAHFLDMANGSAHEAGAGVCIADRLELGPAALRASIRALAIEVITLLGAMTTRMRSRRARSARKPRSGPP